MNMIRPNRSTCLYVIVCINDDGMVVGHWDGTHFSGSPTGAKKFLSYLSAEEEMTEQLMDSNARVVKFSPLKSQTVLQPWI